MANSAVCCAWNAAMSARPLSIMAVDARRLRRARLIHSSALAAAPREATSHGGLSIYLVLGEGGANLPGFAMDVLMVCQPRDRLCCWSEGAANAPLSLHVAGLARQMFGPSRDDRRSWP